MLVVSRMIGVSYVVVDTDDGVETLLPGRDICNLNSKYKLGIKGVRGSSVKPYYDTSVCTRQQLLAEMNYHTRVSVWDDMVTRVECDIHKNTEPAVIRLSHFGTKLGDYIMWECFKETNLRDSFTHRMTLVFDDKLEPVPKLALQPLYTPIYLRGSGGRHPFGVKYDIRGVTDSSLVESIYDSLTLVFGVCVYPQTKAQLYARVIDDEERKSRYLASLPLSL